MTQYICYKRLVKGMRGVVIFNVGELFYAYPRGENRYMVRYENISYLMTSERFLNHFKRPFVFGR